MNSLFQQLNPSQTRPLPSNIKQMIQNFKTMSNPHAMIQEVLQNNPQINSMIQAANGNPEKAFRDLAKKMNVNPEEIISMLK